MYSLLTPFHPGVSPFDPSPLNCVQSQARMRTYLSSNGTDHADCFANLASALTDSNDPTLPPHPPPDILQSSSASEPRRSSSSSRTQLRQDNDNDRDSATLIEEIIRRSGELEGAEDEREVERYGGDDPRDPEEGGWNARKHGRFERNGKEEQATGEVERAECGPGWDKEKDPDLVEWDGPEDPDNPQNWSKAYKWFVTGICAIITFNVYVSYPPHIVFSF